MGLEMRVKRAILRELAQRYQRGRKKEKTRVLEEFIGLTGYNRSYGSWLLFNCFPHQLIVGRDKLNRKVLNHDGFCLKPIAALPGKIINR